MSQSEPKQGSGLLCRAVAAVSGALRSHRDIENSGQNMYAERPKGHVDIRSCCSSFREKVRHCMCEEV